MRGRRLRVPATRRRTSGPRRGRLRATRSRGSSRSTMSRSRASGVKSPMATLLVGGWAMQFLLFAVTASATALFREKEHGIFQRVLSAPVTRGDILWSKFLYGICLGLAPARSSSSSPATSSSGSRSGARSRLLVLVCVFAAAACTSFGMLIAAISPTPESARGLSTFVILLMCAIGGAWFPVSFMPDFIQRFSRLTLVYWSMEGFSQVLWARDTLRRDPAHPGISDPHHGARAWGSPSGASTGAGSSTDAAGAPNFLCRTGPALGESGRLPMPEDLATLVTAIAVRARAASLALAVVPAEARNAALTDLAGRIDALPRGAGARPTGATSPAAQANGLTRGADRPADPHPGAAARTWRSPCARWRRFPDPLGEVLEESTRPNGLAAAQGPGPDRRHRGHLRGPPQRHGRLRRSSA